MSGDENSKWKDKYLRSLDELEEKEKHWAQMEDLLRRTVGRLAHTGYGVDTSLDRQLDRVRDAVRGKREPQILERLAREAGDTAAQAQEHVKRNGAEVGQLMGQMLDRLALSGARKRQAQRLSKDLQSADSMDRLQPLLKPALSLIEKHAASAATQAIADPATPQEPPSPASPPEVKTQPQGCLLSRFLGKKTDDQAPPAAPAAAREQELDADLLEQLLSALQTGPAWSERIAELKQQAVTCRGEQEVMRLLADSAALLSEIAQAAENAEPGATPVVETLPSAAEALLTLLEKLEIPSHLQERLGVIKNAVARAVTIDKVRNAVKSIADLLGDIRRHVQVEKQELEKFIEGVTSRIQILSEHVVDLGGNRDASERSRDEFTRSFQDHMDGMRSRMQDEKDLSTLKQTIESGLDAIESHMGHYVEREQTLTREAQEKIEDLSARLHDMKHEAFLLQKKMQEQRDLALKDPLTGVFNRLAYNERIGSEHERWVRYQAPLSLLVLDIDFFKRINDTFGHLAGDKALKALATRLLQNVREVDIVARYGGEEFIVIMPNTASDEAYKVAEKLRSMIAASGFHYRKQPVNITVSLGVASFREGDTPESVFKRADEALYKAKQSGRNRTCREDEAS